MKNNLRIWLGFLVCFDLAQGDLPIHCPIEEVVGSWQIQSLPDSEVEDELFERHLDANLHQLTFEIELNKIHRVSTSRAVLDLPYKGVSHLIDPRSASWSMIYNSGFVVQLEFEEYSLIFYGSFGFHSDLGLDPNHPVIPSPWVLPDGSTPGYKSDCGSIPRGWVIKRTIAGIISTGYFSASLLHSVPLSTPEGLHLRQITKHDHPLSYLPIEHLPNHVTPKQGACGSCFVLAFAHAYEATWARKNSPINIDREAILSCSYSSQGCNGGYFQSLVLDLMVTGVPLSGCMDTSPNVSSYNTKKAQTCNTSCFDSSYISYPSGFVELQTQARIEDWLLTVGPVPVALSLPQSKISGIVPFDNQIIGSWTYVSHAVVLIGWGQTDQGDRYWEVYNPWGGDVSTMKIARSNFDGILEHYAIGIKVN